MIHFILLLLAFLFFVLGAVNVPARVSWTPLGLACWVASVLIGAWPGVR